MPNQIRSETFKDVQSLTKKLEGLQFDKTIDFYQNIDPTLTPFQNPTKEQWSGSVLALNGKIYGLPFSGQKTGHILEFDPNTNATTKISFSNPTHEIWNDGVLASNGKIYGLPASGQNTGTILEFDPNTNITSFTSFTNTENSENDELPSSGNYEVYTGKLYIDNTIYGIPSSGNIKSYILKFNIITKKPTLIPVHNSENEQWDASVLAPNGYIYGLPSAGNKTSHILELNPLSSDGETPSLISFTNTENDELPSSGNYEMYVPILAPNGCIYGLPSAGNEISYILTFRRTFPQFLTDWLLYPQINSI